ncbi:MAG TPA: nuclear transport factor 2 family protein [Solirubrobacteraceae bacterium]|nr:nuclear transport factor 2 family protein [Solirubrobacteraceae bacterium]
MYESSSPDMAELNRAFVAAARKGDVEALIGFFASDAVWEGSAVGTGTFEGHLAIRGMLEDWLGAYDAFEVEMEEFVDLGNGVTFGVFVQKGRLRGSSGVVQSREAHVSLVETKRIVRVASFLDPSEARAAAERLAAERQ